MRRPGALSLRLRRCWRGTEFRFCIYPLGGYVVLPSADGLRSLGFKGRQKLALKDQIVKIEDMLIPDIIA